MSYKVPYCDECNIIAPTMIIIKDELWKSIVTNKKDYLCYQCIEKRLGRKLELGDLRPCQISNEMYLGALLYAQSVKTFIPYLELEKIMRRIEKGEFSPLT